MKIVILDGYAENPGDLSWEEFEKLGDFTVYDRTPFDDDEIIKRIGDAQIVYTNKTPLNKHVMESCPSIKFIGVLATGFNVVDVKAAKELNIPVSNIPTYGTEGVAQFVFALLLEICHHVGHHDKTVKEGKWEICPDFCYWDYPLICLSGKTMGIIGLGRIGIAVAKIAKALGMNVIAFDNYESEYGKEVATYVSLDELLQKSDVISLHCPLTAENTGFVNKDMFSKMKDGVLIVNTSRGPLVNEEDMAEALNSGKVASYGADVVSTEPIKASNPLLTAKNCIITPHIAWAAKSSREKLMKIASDNLKAFMSGNPINVVNS